MSARIEDYALIGDGETAALVCRDGSIDWLCWPRFDSAACFAALLGDAYNGRWRIGPRDPAARVSRRYREGTLILETEFETDTGSVTLIDFMPPRTGASDLIRIVRGNRGRVALRLDLVLRFDYGRSVPWVTQLDDSRLRAIAGPDMVILQSPVSLHGADLTTVGEFEIDAGESCAFVMTYSASHLELPEAVDAERALAETEDLWREWSARSDLPGRVGGARTAVYDHPQGSYLPADGRRCGRAHDLAAGTHRWHP